MQFWCAEQAKQAEEKIKETKAKREEFEEKREHLNEASREAARAIADAKEAKAQESRLAAAAKSHQKVAETEEQTAARVSHLFVILVYFFTLPEWEGVDGCADEALVCDPSHFCFAGGRRAVRVLTRLFSCMHAAESLFSESMSIANAGCDGVG